MMKMKTLIRSTYSFVFIAIILALLTNFYLTPRILYYQNANLDEIGELRTLFTQKEMQLRILENIDRQTAGDWDASGLNEAMDRNRREMNRLLTKAEEPLEGLEENYGFLENLPLNPFSEKVGEFHELKEDLYSIQGDIRGEIAGYQPGISSSVVGESLQNYEKTLETMDENLRATNDKMLTDLSSLGNLVILILILFLLMVSLLYYRVHKVNLPYFKKILTMVAYKGDDSASPPKMKPIFQEEKESSKMVEKILEDKTFSREVSDLLSESFILEDVMEGLFKKIRSKIEIDRIGVGFVDYNNGKIIAEYGIHKQGEVLLGPGFDVPIKTSSLAEFIKDPKPEINNDLEGLFKKRPESLSLDLLMKEGIKANMTFPLLMGRGVFGMVFFSSEKKGAFNREDLKTGEELVREITPLVTRAYFVKIVFSQMTLSFSELVEGKDQTTGAHISRMVAYSVKMARLLQKSGDPGYRLNDREILSIERYAPSHDIGKVSVPDDILKKNGPLTEEEWQLMKKHPGVGADIFKNLGEGLALFSTDYFITAENIARYHHERWDGSGYPEGLAGNRIPLEARIVAFGDVLDALCSKRPYKKAFTFQEAGKIIEESSGTHFDPMIVNTFLQNYREFQEIYQELGEKLAS